MECTTLSVQMANSDQIELPLAQLKEVFATVPDPRCQNGQLDYPLWLMLLAVTAGLLAGQTSLLACAEWLAVQDLSFKQKLGFKAAATPVQSTFQRLFCTSFSDGFASSFNNPLRQACGSSQPAGRRS